MGGDENISERETGSGSFSRNISNIPMEISIAEASEMFPGFRFSPTDEELIRYYLTKKLQGSDNGVELIPEVDICRYEPWDLPAQSVIQSENEWFFFSPRGRKYPNGSQSKRATGSGYWKATGKERSVKCGSNLIGTKRTLVFHTGRAPKGQRTEWIMHEYCMSEKSQDAMVVCRLRKNNDFHLSDGPRRNSLNQRDLLGENNNTNGLSNGELSCMLEEAKVADNCSKEGSCSYNSHSVEQVDAASSDSDEKLTSGFSHPDTSSHRKSYAEEEDCYADIMKDDIIKLDDSSLTSPSLLPIADVKLKACTNSTQQQPSQTTVSSQLPFQGTANRRLRLRRQRRESYGSEQSEIYKFGKESGASIENVADMSSKKAQLQSSLIDHFQIARMKLPVMLILFLVMLILLVLCMGDSLGANKLKDIYKFERLYDIKWYGYFPAAILR
ncbi:hypothetical protein ACJIZ3_017399 [Penstemon smallii]|uniref:NAC domain-containing protein n=1 Tax=Penstemon smallii TaxID=265156 RepID=A0ABD3SVI5_9LAMI